MDEAKTQLDAAKEELDFFEFNKNVLVDTKDSDPKSWNKNEDDIRKATLDIGRLRSTFQKTESLYNYLKNESTWEDTKAKAEEKNA